MLDPDSASETKFAESIRFLSSRKIRTQSLLRAKALVAMCSKQSRTSPWLWWEAATVWAREGLVIPLFLDVTPGEFAGPLTVVRQGRSIRDPGELQTVLERVVAQFRPGSRVPLLTVIEQAALENALSTCAAQSSADNADPLLRSLRATKFATKVFLQPLPARNVDDVFHLEAVEHSHVTLVKESNQDRVNVPIEHIQSFSPRSPYADDMLLTLRPPGRLSWNGELWRFALV